MTEWRYSAPGPTGIPTSIRRRRNGRSFEGKLDDLNLEVSNYGADFWGISPAASDADAGKYKDAFKRNLEFCLDIGGDSIRVDTAVGDVAGGRRGGDPRSVM